MSNWFILSYHSYFHPSSAPSFLHFHFHSVSIYWAIIKKKKKPNNLHWKYSQLPFHSTSMSSSKLWELVMDWKAWNTAVHGATKSQTLLSDWTELNSIMLECRVFYLYTCHKTAGCSWGEISQAWWSVSLVISSCKQVVVLPSQPTIFCWYMFFVFQVLTTFFSHHP